MELWGGSPWVARPVHQFARPARAANIGLVSLTSVPKFDFAGAPLVADWKRTTPPPSCSGRRGVP